MELTSLLYFTSGSNFFTTLNIVKTFEHSLDFAIKLKFENVHLILILYNVPNVLNINFTDINSVILKCLLKKWYNNTSIAIRNDFGCDFCKDLRGNFEVPMSTTTGRFWLQFHSHFEILCSYPGRPSKFGYIHGNFAKFRARIITWCRLISLCMNHTQNAPV